MFLKYSFTLNLLYFYFFSSDILLNIFSFIVVPVKSFLNVTYLNKCFFLIIYVYQFCETTSHVSRHCISIIEH